MDKVFTIAVREFIETVKTKTFFISSVLVPMLMVGVIMATQWIAERTEGQAMPTKHIGVVDETGAVYPIFEKLLAERNEQNPNRVIALEQAEPGEESLEALRERVRSGELYAYFIVPAGVISGEDQCELGRKDSQLEVGERLKRMLNDAIVEVRFERADPPIDVERVHQLQARVDFRGVDVRTGQETTGNELVRFMTPFAFMFLLFMGTMAISQGLLTSLIEEKSSRIVEVLLSAVSPTQLLAGKILGMVGVGAVLLSVWGVMGYFGARSQDMSYLVTPYRLTYMVLYFVPGFLLTSAFLGAIGSACNTLKDAQSMAAPLTILTIVPMMLWWAIAENPNSTLSIVLSFIPPITPFVMILRICADPETPLWQILATQAVLWASVLLGIWAAGKIFRVGVLMYGKPPSLKELLRWVRYA